MLYKHLCAGLVILSLFLFASFNVHEETYPMSQQEFYGLYIKHPEYVDIIYDANKYYGVEPEIIIALIKWESGFDPNAIGYNKFKGRVISVDQGLGQLNSNYFTGTYVFDPVINIHITVKHFSEVLDTVPTVADAIRKYRSGGTSRKNPDVEKYVGRILSDIYDLKQAYQNYLNAFYEEEKGG
jgi:soluble lytic murein transglycosylase-like protein